MTPCCPLHVTLSKQEESSQAAARWWRVVRGSIVIVCSRCVGSQGSPSHHYWPLLTSHPWPLSCDQPPAAAMHDTKELTEMEGGRNISKDKLCTSICIRLTIILFLWRYGGTDGDGRYLSFLIDILLLHAIHKGAYEVVKATGLLNSIIDRHDCRRAQYWEDPANDPRWNKDHFQFSPKLERAAGEGYERLSVGSSVGSRCGYCAVIGHMQSQYWAVIGWAGFPARSALPSSEAASATSPVFRGEEAASNIGSVLTNCILAGTRTKSR